jgi:hypothetical protein
MAISLMTSLPAGAFVGGLRRLANGGVVGILVLLLPDRT